MPSSPIIDREHDRVANFTHSELQPVHAVGVDHAFGDFFLADHGDDHGIRAGRCVIDHDTADDCEGGLALGQGHRQGQRR